MLDHTPGLSGTGSPYGCVFIVLINLLIAMLSDTYQRIQARSDLEWKYGRAKLIMNMDKSAVSPPPVNVVTVLGTYAYQGTKGVLAVRFP